MLPNPAEPRLLFSRVGIGGLGHGAGTLCGAEPAHNLYGLRVVIADQVLYPICPIPEKHYLFRLANFSASEMSQQ